MARVPVRGGPADGCTAARAGARRWIAADGSGSARPGPGRALYAFRRGGYAFVGTDARICTRCKGVTTQALIDWCVVCGHPTVPAGTLSSTTSWRP